MQSVSTLSNQVHLMSYPGHAPSGALLGVRINSSELEIERKESRRRTFTLRGIIDEEDSWGAKGDFCTDIQLEDLGRRPVVLVSRETLWHLNESKMG